METEIQQPVAAISRFQATQQKVDRLLALNKITLKDLDDFNQLERKYIAERCTLKLQDLTGTERENFLEKIGPIITPATSAGIWEQNHAEISYAITAYIHKYGTMPNKSTIAQQTGISRKTVTKHIEACQNHPEFTAQMEQFQLIAPRVLASMVKKALAGDTRAARVYFEMVGAPTQQANNKTTNTQNNYIQINNTILSQDGLKQLTAEQLDQIEGIVKGRRG